MLRKQHYKDIAHSSYCSLYLFPCGIIGEFLLLPRVDGVVGSSVSAVKGTGIGGNGAVVHPPPIIITCCFPSSPLSNITAGIEAAWLPRMASVSPKHCFHSPCWHLSPNFRLVYIVSGHGMWVDTDQAPDYLYLCVRFFISVLHCSHILLYPKHSVSQGYLFVNHTIPGHPVELALDISLSP